MDHAHTGNLYLIRILTRRVVNLLQSSVSVLALEPVKTVSRFQHPLKQCTVEIGSAQAVRGGERI